MQAGCGVYALRYVNGHTTVVRSVWRRNKIRYEPVSLGVLYLPSDSTESLLYAVAALAGQRYLDMTANV